MKALLVITCFYESKRLPRFLIKLCELVESSDLSIEIQLVDDGSSQKEQKALFDLSQKLKPQYSFLREPLLLAENLGKGGAVRAGWRKRADASTLAFVDADGAASAEETIRFLGIIEASEAQNRVFIATRDSKAGRDLKRKWSRKIVAKVFNRLIRIRYDIQVSDTQCGLKAIPESSSDQRKTRWYKTDTPLIWKYFSRQKDTAWSLPPSLSIGQKYQEAAPILGMPGRS